MKEQYENIILDIVVFEEKDILTNSLPIEAIEDGN